MDSGDQNIEKSRDTDNPISEVPLICEYCNKNVAIKTDGSSRFICGKCANPPNEPYRRDVRAGRNEPCPCGSGLKRKRCKHE